MSFIDEQVKRINRNDTVIVYPEGCEPNIISAVAQVTEMNFAIPVLIGPENKIKEIAENLKVNINGIRIINPQESDKLDEYVDIFSKMTGFPITTAKILLKKPLYYAAMMAKTGDADCMVAGIATETAEVVAAYKMILGMMDGIHTPSCISIVESQFYKGEVGNLVAMADTAINVAPNAEELADIALASAKTVKDLLGWTPRIAMLSFSTLSSSNHERAKLVANAVSIVKSREPEIYIDGEMQVDAALSVKVAERKFNRPSEVAGRANVFVFPNLDASNIGIKLLQRMGGASSSGGVLQGFSKPVCDLSRGADISQVVRNSVVLAKISCSRKENEGGN